MPPAAQLVAVAAVGCLAVAAGWIGFNALLAEAPWWRRAGGDARARVVVGVAYGLFTVGTLVLLLVALL